MRTLEFNLCSDMQAIDMGLRSVIPVGFADLHTEMAAGMNRQIRWLATIAMGWTSILLAALRFMG